MCISYLCIKKIVQTTNIVLNQEPIDINTSKSAKFSIMLTKKFVTFNFSLPLVFSSVTCHTQLYLLQIEKIRCMMENRLSSQIDCMLFSANNLVPK